MNSKKNKVKGIILISILFISHLSFAQSEAVITWENCSIEGVGITNKLMENKPDVYKDILVLVVYKSKKLGYVPSSNWIHREINRQSFAHVTIFNWVKMVGGVNTEVYKNRVDKNLMDNMVFIPQFKKFFLDHGSLYKEEFLPQERK